MTWRMQHEMQEVIFPRAPCFMLCTKFASVTPQPLTQSDCRTCSYACVLWFPRISGMIRRPPGLQIFAINAAILPNFSFANWDPIGNHSNPQPRAVVGCVACWDLSFHVLEHCHCRRLAEQKCQGLRFMTILFKHPGARFNVNSNSVTPTAFRLKSPDANSAKVILLFSRAEVPSHVREPA